MASCKYTQNFFFSSNHEYLNCPCIKLYPPENYLSLCELQFLMDGLSSSKTQEYCRFFFYFFGLQECLICASIHCGKYSQNDCISGICFLCTVGICTCELCQQIRHSKRAEQRENGTGKKTVGTRKCRLNGAKLKFPSKTDQSSLI